MAETLKPCPLCGSTDTVCFAEEYGYGYDDVPTFRAVVGCRGCREEGCDPSYDDEPCFGIEAYFRADHPLVRDCEDPWDIERVLVHHMAEKWDRRAGRTCHYVYDREICAWRCSECGGLEPVGDHVRYCPDCGARIEDEVDE